MIVSITGGSGFIGHRLVQRHLARGDEVRVLSRRTQDEAGLQEGVRWFVGDLAGQADLGEFVRGADVLYHCAGEVNDPSAMRSVHVEGTARLIAAASGHVGRWVQLSSVGAYGRRRSGVITEETPLAPEGVYELTKTESDALAQAAARGGAFEHVLLRPSNVYGAGMPNRSLCGMMAMIRRGAFFFIGEPGAMANYIHADNVVEALLLCGAVREAAGGTFIVSDQRTMEQFVAIMSDALHLPAPRLRLPEWPVRTAAKLLGRLPGFPLTESRVDALTGRAVYSSVRIERVLGYRPCKSMEEGLQELAWDCLQKGGR
jgi:nucleoside-diphosphate-sugar epimerase